MSLYANHVFPRLMEWTMRAWAPLRAEWLASARGDVLEVGFGTGLNLEHYPAAVTSLTAVDPSAPLPRRVERRLALARFPVRRVRASAETLPFDDASFDTVVTTWTLCSIPSPVTALREMRRVLRSSGRYLFVEHGRSDDPRIARWQRFWNPVQFRIGCGCHLDRPIDALVRDAGFEITRLDRFAQPGVPRLVGKFYRGDAVPGAR
ncbi:MAG: class I SAM-dependent methyltransferase [Planctomycetes bacterium]|nr:class I SAM-dependent methyltransferase [Planctomycetota bacterium]MBI3846338.1 class I SAM-dependent methyltransferase [Planctomycetota bacterium]